MNKYINAENVKNKIIKYHAGLRPRYITRLDDALISDICDIIDEENQADVQPVVHAFWRKFKDDKYDLRMMCSNCGYVHAYMKNKKYCPMCGAKMDGDEHDNG